MTELSIILPVHNEEKGIEEFVYRLTGSLDKENFSYEILFIENGSTDNSFLKLKKLQKKNSQISVYQSVKGWGNAVRKGIEMARGKYFCYMVSDGQIDPDNIKILYQKIKKGKAELFKVKRINRENFTRFFVSQIYNLLARFLFGIKGSDINATPKIIKTDLIRSFNLSAKNIALDIELLYKLKNRNMLWEEVKIYSNPRKQGKSTTSYKSALEMIFNMIKLRFTGNL